MWLYRRIVSQIESGRVPDSATRIGIRHLCGQRAKEVSRRPISEDQRVLGEFRDASSEKPIALVPDRANEQHYEVPAEFFATVLGPHQKYSCCYWSDDVSSLGDAEKKSLELTSEHAELEDGMRVLDLGCGWGSFSLWAAATYPNCQITAVSNSNGQREYIQQKASHAGLTNLDVITADMNSFEAETQFDRVVSIEMFEHMRNHRKLLQRISNWLVPGGKLLVHVFCHKRQPYLYPDSDPDDWMGYYFFAGGMMPSQSLLPSYQDDLTLRGQWDWNGRHYEKTCNAWLERMDADRDKVMGIMRETYGAENARKWFVRWRLFFMACAELFGYRHGEEWFVAHYRFEKGN